MKVINRKTLVFPIEEVLRKLRVEVEKVNDATAVNATTGEAIALTELRVEQSA